MPEEEAILFQEAVVKRRIRAPRLDELAEPARELVREAMKRRPAVHRELPRRRRCASSERVRRHGQRHRDSLGERRKPPFEQPHVRATPSRPGARAIPEGLLHQRFVRRLEGIGGMEPRDALQHDHPHRINERPCARAGVHALPANPEGCVAPDGSPGGPALGDDFRCGDVGKRAMG